MFLITSRGDQEEDIPAEQNRDYPDYLDQKGQDHGSK